MREAYVLEVIEKAELNIAPSNISDSFQRLISFEYPNVTHSHTFRCEEYVELFGAIPDMSYMLLHSALDSLAVDHYLMSGSVSLL